MATEKGTREAGTRALGTAARCAALIAAIALGGVPARAFAAPPDSPAPAATDSQAPAPSSLASPAPSAATPSPPPPSVVPVAAPAPVSSPAVNHRLLFGAAMLGDYTSFWQNATSVKQVGVQASRAQIRSARVTAAGDISSGVSYYASLNYNGLDLTPDEPIFGLYDLYLTFKSPIALITVGKQKQTFTYEMVGPAAFLPQMERVLSPFAQSRDLGVKFNNTAFNQRATWAVGWWGFDDQGRQATARVTALPYLSQDGSSWFHLGVDYRYQGAVGGTLRFRGKPQSDVASYFVDTGKFLANFSNDLNYEAIVQHGPFSAYGEYTRAWVSAPASENPEFFGYYVVGSWVLTGEHRGYAAAGGVAKQIIPLRPSGAWEFVTQYSRIDLNSGKIAGGNMGIGYVGVNWWKDRFWKFGVAYGVTGLTKSNTYGVTNRLQLRVQWVH
jgi:phosphate-selective porin OprO/OprP